MALPQQNTPPTVETIEPDDDITGSINSHNYDAQRRQYWHRIYPGGVLIPPPLSPFPEHPPVCLPEQPPAPAAPSHQKPRLEDQSATDKNYQAASVDEALDVSPEPTAQDSQPGATNALQVQSPGDGTTAPSLSPEPHPQERQRCEVWPLTYRSANGLFKLFWCVQVDGESYYQHQPPNLEDLSRRYHLVYFPDLASYEAQVNQ
ncbi:hypothetical protein C8A01DRAFT_41619 [Parachaetomium inaequale]|uniref:Uncharacterized protein n=1 Tax=Parachaetomium inaequale TaxID=2588326 RepID=A0AAN6P704_9PEZI|nr:hypothetical protein C8A01DRAFT_41619 [Parachaetomium inaequale]